MKFTPAQREILSLLDGKADPLELPGTSKRSAAKLAEMGLVTAKPFSKHVQYGGFSQYSTHRAMVRVTLTKAGADFIYNGGIDY